MAEERTLGLSRVHDISGDELSKEELQRRMDEARDSISQTVTEIKDSVVQQYESVKETISDTLDWREQFKKQPVAWSAGAVGAGFIAGYGLAAIIKGPNGGNGNGNGHGYGRQDDYHPAAFATQLSPAARATPAASQVAAFPEPAEDSGGPGLLARIQETPAFDRVRSEAATVGNRFVDEISKTAQEVLLPAAIGMIKGWLEGLVSRKDSPSSPFESKSAETSNRSSRPALEPVR
jgi:hypothetical protein